ncbi:hypothetical protein [Candidatus Ichthyocystis sparus]|uniref:hypothetical protein n=1 Tax=Candidatus Ichthyocystis sparus TaxID=1561004 RepID=UPI000B11A7F7|nr:hypothetical protein [Candidatus Ichthyocystis sparus]
MRTNEYSRQSTDDTDANHNLKESGTINTSGKTSSGRELSQTPEEHSRNKDKSSAVSDALRRAAARGAGANVGSRTSSSHKSAISDALRRASAGRGSSESLSTGREISQTSEEHSRNKDRSSDVYDALRRAAARVAGANVASGTSSSHKPAMSSDVLRRASAGRGSSESLSPYSSSVSAISGTLSDALHRAGANIGSGQSSSRKLDITVREKASSTITKANSIVSSLGQKLDNTEEISQLLLTLREDTIPLYLRISNRLMEGYFIEENTYPNTSSLENLRSRSEDELSEDMIEDITSQMLNMHKKMSTYLMGAVEEVKALAARIEGSEDIGQPSDGLKKMLILKMSEIDSTIDKEFSEFQAELSYKYDLLLKNLVSLTKVVHENRDKLINSAHNAAEKYGLLEEKSQKATSYQSKKGTSSAKSRHGLLGKGGKASLSQSKKRISEAKSKIKSLIDRASIKKGSKSDEVDTRVRSRSVNLMNSLLSDWGEHTIPPSGSDVMSVASALSVDTDYARATSKYLLRALSGE